MLRNVVIVGASLAGLRAAETLRTQGFDGTVTLVNGESHLPYDRPPLSKRVLAGDLQRDDIQLRKEADYEPLDLDIRFGRLATALDPAAQTLTLDDGETLPYDGLILATGATPRQIPGTPDLEGIYVLRTLEDCLSVRAELDKTPSRVVVVGAGFIGAEVAATAAQARPRGHHPRSAARAARRARSATTWVRHAQPCTRTTASRCARARVSMRSKGRVASSACA